MLWYGGSIAEAVNLSKQRNAIFVVFVEGDNEQTLELSTTLNDGVIVKKLSDEKNFLVVKLRSGSADYTHFAQIYQFVPVPSVFFIGRNGTPLEVVCAGVEPTNLSGRIDRILEEHNKEGASSVQPSTSAQSIKEQTQSLIQSEAASAKKPSTSDVPTCSQKSVSPASPTELSEPAAKIPRTEAKESSKAEPEYEVVCDGDVCVKTPKSLDQPGPSRNITADEPSKEQLVQEAPPLESPNSVEDKLDHAKEVIEAKRREKEEKDKELLKKKEIERRSTGQGVAELKKWQADQEMKQLQEDRKREKIENTMARQRILEQIAQDRAERRARDSPPVAPPTTAMTATVTATTANTSPGDAASSARIQFKLPDGTSHTAQFNASDTLNIVQRYVADNLQLPTTSFSLWTAFPRRELLETEATLTRLELAPSAALLVLARRQSAAVSRPSTVSNFISLISTLFTSIILQPAHNVFSWVRGRFFPSESPPEPRAESPTRPAAPGLRYRPRTNIHRLTGDRPNDDDNNTWNGNSTQQM